RLLRCCRGTFVGGRRFEPWRHSQFVRASLRFGNHLNAGPRILVVLGLLVGLGVLLVEPRQLRSLLRAAAFAPVLGVGWRRLRGSNRAPVESDVRILRFQLLPRFLIEWRTSGLDAGR